MGNAQSNQVRPLSYQYNPRCVVLRQLRDYKIAPHFIIITNIVANDRPCACSASFFRSPDPASLLSDPPRALFVPPGLLRRHDGPQRQDELRGVLQGRHGSPPEGEGYVVGCTLTHARISLRHARLHPCLTIPNHPPIPTTFPHPRRPPLPPPLPPSLSFSLILRT